MKPVETAILLGEDLLLEVAGRAHGEVHGFVEVVPCLPLPPQHVLGHVGPQETAYLVQEGLVLGR